MSTASNSSTALAPRTGFVHPYSRGSVGRMSNASNWSGTWGECNAYYNVPAVGTESRFEEIVTKTVRGVLQKMPIEKLEDILDWRRREEPI